MNSPTHSTETASPPQIRVNVTMSVTMQQIEDQLCAAWEGGSAYWVECYDVRPPTDAADQARVEYRYQNALYAGGACLMRITEDGEEGEELELTLEKLVAGVQVFADLCPNSFQDMVQEDGDANTGDMFLQCCLFGKLVYG